MGTETILYISDQGTSSDAVLAALNAAGYDVVNTSRPTEAIALLFVMQSVAAVVLNHQAREQSSFDVARSLRLIRPHVPIILLCRVQIDHLAELMDASVSTGEPFEELTSAVQCLLTAKRFRVLSRQC